jgi:hypothetical protein
VGIEDLDTSESRLVWEFAIRCAIEDNGYSSFSNPREHGQPLDKPSPSSRLVAVPARRLPHDIIAVNYIRHRRPWPSAAPSQSEILSSFAIDEKEGQIRAAVDKVVADWGESTTFSYKRRGARLGARRLSLRCRNNVVDRSKDVW